MIYGNLKGVPPYLDSTILQDLGIYHNILGLVDQLDYLFTWTVNQ